VALVVGAHLLVIIGVADVAGADKSSMQLREPMAGLKIARSE
jgi:hypothetical protein